MRPPLGSTSPVCCSGSLQPFSASSACGLVGVAGGSRPSEAYDWNGVCQLCQLPEEVVGTEWSGQATLKDVALLEMASDVASGPSHGWQRDHYLYNNNG